MADHDNAQDYTANGPTAVGFRTGGDGTGIANGVIAVGTEIGVTGTGVGIEGNKRSVGVVGTGPSYGVQGFSPLTGVFGQSDQFSGVQGFGKTGVEGFGDSVGVRGESPVTGVQGVSTAIGTGVLGECDAGVGVDGHSVSGSGVNGRSEVGYGGVFASNVAQIRLLPATTFGPPRNGAHVRGELFVDARGALFYCSGGSPANWQQLGGPSLFSDVISAITRPIRQLLGG